MSPDFWLWFWLGFCVGLLIAVKLVAWLLVKAFEVVASWFLNWDQPRK